MEGHYRLRPANQFHHLATVHMLGGERNGQQAQRALDNEQRQDQDIRSGSGCTHAWAEQTTLQQQHAANQTQHTAGTTSKHRHFLFHFNRQPGFIHPVRRQHTEEVTDKNPQNTDMEQVRCQVHPFAIQHLAGRRAPGVLPVVITQPATNQEDRPGYVRVDIKEEHIQELH